MPFKGDMRLGGPHDNEVGLRGSSEGNGGGFPPYGTFHQTLTGQEYPYEEGGEYFYFFEGGYNVPSQICDVDQMHDGAGGYFIDWYTVTNIAYKAVGTLFAQGPQYPSDPVEVPDYSGVYYDSALSHDDFKHDGIGGYSLTVVLESYLAGEVDAGLRMYYEVEVPAGSGAFYQNGNYDTYVWDGLGPAYALATNQGSYYPNGTFLASVQEYTYFGDTGYETNAATGRTYTYTWNGNGGANAPSVSGQYYPNGAVIGYFGPTQTPVEVPSNSGTYYDSVATKFIWNGSGGAIDAGMWYYPNGTFIISEGGSTGINYYWDGNGSYYDVPY